MYKASAGVLLPTSIIGSLPRPAWHTVQLGSRSFLEAMVNARWREQQYEDAVSTHLRAQEAGLDICTDGDAHYDEEIQCKQRVALRLWRFFAYGISRSIDHRSTLSAGHGL